jgi:histidinol phosphatase-like enzyme (inositol monophosphatase family)
MLPSLTDILNVAIEAAAEAGKITLGYFQTSAYEVETKEDLSPVTIADRRAEERIVAIVRRYFPDHAILGEESGASAGNEPIRWIIDPIDGTKSFIRGVPLYGTMIGVEIEGEAQVGVVNIPALGEMHYGARGHGSYCNGRRSRVSSVSAMKDAMLMLTDVRPYMRNRELTEVYGRFVERTFLQRTWGDCYGYMLVATGRADIMLDNKMSPWDCAALKPIIEEAGGIFTDWNGTPTIHGGNAVATNGLLHNEVLSILNQRP